MWSEWKDKLASVDRAYTDEEAARLFELAGQTPEELWIVEVGSFRGGSGMALAAGSLARPEPRLVLVDIWGLGPLGKEYKHLGSGCLNIGMLLELSLIHI